MCELNSLQRMRWVWRSHFPGMPKNLFNSTRDILIDIETHGGAGTRGSGINYDDSLPILFLDRPARERQRHECALAALKIRRGLPAMLYVRAALPSSPRLAGRSRPTSSEGCPGRSSCGQPQAAVTFTVTPGPPARYPARCTRPRTNRRRNPRSGCCDRRKAAAGCASLES